MGKYSSLFKELKSFIFARKLWWLTPILMILVLLSVFIILTEGSALLPFIYAGF